MTDDEIRDLLLPHGADLRTLSLLDCCVGRILRRDARRGPVEAPSAEDLGHVADWLFAASRSEAFWLSRTDADGRPLKLMKLGSVAACVAEADKAMRMEAGRSCATVLGPDDEIVEFDCGDGFAIVRLATPAALDLEGSRMGHCIGAGSYDDRVSRYDHCYLSLRGPNGSPHATIELRSAFRGRSFRTATSVVQAKGKGNTLPVLVHRVRIASFLTAYGIEVPEDVMRDLAVDSRGRVSPVVAQVPMPGAISGSISVVGNEALLLPENLEIEGDLTISHSSIERLPAGLKVSGRIVVAECPSFDPASSSDLAGAEGASLSGCGIGTFHDDGSLGSLLLVGSGTSEDVPLPRRVVVGSGRPDRIAYVGMAGSVEVRPCTIADLTVSGCAGLVFGVSLDVRELSVAGTEVGTWPERLRVRDRFATTACRLETLPRFERSPKHIEILFEPRLRVLPSDFGRTSVTVRDSGLESISAGRRAFGKLSIHRCPLRSLPDGLHVRGDLVLDGLPIASLPSGLVVDGELRVVRCGLRTLPPDLVVRGSLVVQDCDLEGVPATMRVGGRVVLERCGLASLPPGFRVRKDLFLAGNPIGELPSGLDVGGNLDARCTGVRRLPSDARVGGRTYLRPETGASGHGIDRELARPPTFLDVLGGFLVRGDGFVGPVENSSACTGVVVDAGGCAHRTDRPLPAGLVVEGDLEMSERGVVFGIGTVVGGSLRLTGSDDVVLAPGTVVGGDLVVEGGGMGEGCGGIDRDASPVVVGGNLVVRRSLMQVLPDVLHVRGDAWIEARSAHLPIRLVVDGDLSVSTHDLHRWEGEARIGGDLLVDGSWIPELSESIVVEGSVVLSPSLSHRLDRTIEAVVDGILKSSERGGPFRLLRTASDLVGRLRPRPGNNFIERLRPTGTSSTGTEARP